MNERSSQAFFSNGSDSVRLKNVISGPMNRAVIMVPMPGMNPSAKPIPTQIRSQMIRTTLNGTIFPKARGFLSAICSGMASYVDTPRSAV